MRPRRLPNDMHPYGRGTWRWVARAYAGQVGDRYSLVCGDRRRQWTGTVPTRARRRSCRPNRRGPSQAWRPGALAPVLEPWSALAPGRPGRRAGALGDGSPVGTLRALYAYLYPHSLSTRRRRAVRARSGKRTRARTGARAPVPVLDRPSTLCVPTALGARSCTATKPVSEQKLRTSDVSFATRSPRSPPVSRRPLHCCLLHPPGHDEHGTRSGNCPSMSDAEPVD